MDDWEDDGSEWVDDNSPCFFENPVNQEVSPIESEILNAFYEADDLRLENRSEALVQFKKVLDLSKQVVRLEDETLMCVFNSIRYMASIYLEMKKLEEMIDTYRILLAFVPKVTANDAQETVTGVLVDVENYPDKGFVAQIFRETSETLRTFNNQERFWFFVNKRYCNFCCERAEYKEASEILQTLKKYCQLADGQDDLNKASFLAEVYALEMTMATATQDTAKLKEFYEKTKNLTCINEPKTRSIFRECWGHMFANEGDWSQALLEFFKAFIAYQEVGYHQKSIQCLKYLTICSMLANSPTNPFDCQEARHFQSDKKMEPYDALRVAYEKANVQKFANALEAILKDGDVFVKKNLDIINHNFHQKAIKKLIKPYRRVRLDFLAQTLCIPVSQVESLLIQLVLDNEIEGSVDQINGLFNLTESVNSSSRYIAIDHWASTVNNLRQTIPTPAFH